MRATFVLCPCTTNIGEEGSHLSRVRKQTRKALFPKKQPCVSVSSEGFKCKRLSGGQHEIRKKASRQRTLYEFKCRGDHAYAAALQRQRTEERRRMWCVTVQKLQAVQKSLVAWAVQKLHGQYRSCMGSTEVAYPFPPSRRHSLSGKNYTGSADRTQPNMNRKPLLT